MNNDTKCPICGQLNSITSDSSLLHINCNRCKRRFNVNENILSPNHKAITYGITADYEKRMNIITEFLIQNPTKGNYWNFLYKVDTSKLKENDVDIYGLLEHYPRTIDERICRSLINLSFLYTKLEDDFSSSDPLVPRALFCESQNKTLECETLLKMISDMGYIMPSIFENSKQKYMFSAVGIKKLEELRAKNIFNYTAFIAMSFAKEAETLFATYQTILKEIKFEAFKISDKEYNGQIVPEILHSIRESRFVLVDVSIPNYGAYYEAGYALGIGKEVIFCCQADTFNSDKKELRPHFDIAQNCMIIWNDEKDLKEKLEKRIKATILNTI